MTDASQGQSQSETSLLLSSADSYMMSASVLAAASSALTNARQLLKKEMDKYEHIFQTNDASSQIFQAAALSIQNVLLLLTQCRTFYTMKTLKNRHIIGWDKDDMPKYGVKPAMHYTKGRHLLSLTTASEGRHYDWKMDFQAKYDQTGTEMFHKDFPDNIGDDPQQMLEFLRQVGNRIDQYRQYNHKKILNRNEMRTRRGQQEAQRPKSLETMLQTLENVYNVFSASIEKVKNQQITMSKHNYGIGFHWQDNMHDAQQASVHVPDMDADVGHNPLKRRYVKLHDRDNNTTIEIIQQYAFRRPWGVHLSLENKYTIDFINNMLPHVSGGWFEVIVTMPDNLSHKIQLTPWERPSTTVVRPFSIIAKSTPLHQGHLPTFDAFEYRGLQPDEFQCASYDPYLIYGKGNEIDGMVHALKTLDKIQENISVNLQNYVEGFPNVPNVLPFIRAYYSTDDARAGNLGCVGDRSIFFFNVQGVIVGVEMSSPSLPPHVNYLKHSHVRDLPRNNQRQHNPQHAPGWAAMPQAPNYVVNGGGDIMSVLRNLQQMVHRMDKKIHEAENAVGGGQQPDNGGGGGNQRRMQRRYRNADPTFEGTDPNSQYMPHLEYTDVRALFKKSVESGALDPVGFRVSAEEPDLVPIVVTVSNLPTFNGDEKEGSVSFHLDKDTYAELGLPVYKHETREIYLHPTVYHKPGMIHKKYLWGFYFKPESNIQPGINPNGQRAQSVWYKINQSDFLVGDDCSLFSENLLWHLEHVIITINAGVEKVNLIKTKYDEGIMLKINFKESGKVISETARDVVTQDTRIPCPVQGMCQENQSGLVQDWYIMRCHSEFSGDPDVDYYGKLTNVIQLNLKLDYVCQDDQDGMSYKLTFENVKMSLTDRHTPQYKGEVYGIYQEIQGDTVHTEELNPTTYPYEVTLTRYWNSNEKCFTWGLQCGVINSHAMFIAKKKVNDEYGQPMPTSLLCDVDDDSWDFLRDHNWQKIKLVTFAELTIKKLEEGDGEERIPQVQRVDPRAEDEDNDYHSPLTLAQTNARYKAVTLERQEYALKFMDDEHSDGYRARFALHVMTKDQMDWMRGRLSDANSNFKVSYFKVPARITADLAGRRTVMGIVDLQGPVYMSEDGEFIIAPHVAYDKGTGRDMVTWGLYRWRRTNFYYTPVAYKINQVNNSLLNDADTDTPDNNSWRLYHEWDGTPVPDDSFYERRPEAITVLPVMREGNKDLFQFFPRFPTYTVKEEDMAKVKEVKDLNHGPLSANAADGDTYAVDIGSLVVYYPFARGTPWEHTQISLFHFFEERLGNDLDDEEGDEGEDETEHAEDAQGAAEAPDSLPAPESGGVAGSLGRCRQNYDEDEEYMLRQCFDLASLTEQPPPPARLPAQPRRLAAPTYQPTPEVPLHQRNLPAPRGRCSLETQRRNYLLETQRGGCSLETQRRNYLLETQRGGCSLEARQRPAAIGFPPQRYQSMPAPLQTFAPWRPAEPAAWVK